MYDTNHSFNQQLSIYNKASYNLGYDNYVGTSFLGKQDDNNVCQHCGASGGWHYSNCINQFNQGRIDWNNMHYEAYSRHILNYIHPEPMTYKCNIRLIKAQ